jgi:D-alanyl-D-alanine carboxypeptidase
MKYFSHLFVVLCFAVLIAASVLHTHADAAANENKPFAPETQKAIEAAVNKELAAFGGNTPVPGVALGIWAPGQGTLVKGIGYSNLAPQTPMAIDDKFRVGSNTKTFVITVLLQLIDEKKLSLDDPLSKFDVGVIVPNADHITVRELCLMRSGLLDAYHTPQMSKMDITVKSTFTPQQLVAFSAANPPLFAPNAEWNYSNTNYLLLGLIIEAVAKHPVNEEITKRLIVPLGLHDTTFPMENPDMPLPFTHGFELDAQKNWTDATVTYAPSLTWAAGVMISDMADMKTWVKAYVTGTTNGAATQKARLDCVPVGKYGLAFGLGIGCSGGWYGYTGGIAGYNTGAYYFPTEGATIIAFVNSQQEKPDPGVANAIFRDVTQILYPNNVAFPTDPSAKLATK